jgi:hypothetical protein
MWTALALLSLQQVTRGDFLHVHELQHAPESSLSFFLSFLSFSSFFCPFFFSFASIVAEVTDPLRPRSPRTYLLAFGLGFRNPWRALFW